MVSTSDRVQTPAMNCADITAHLDAYHDDELDAANAGTIAEHVAACPACSTAVAERRRLRVYLRRHGSAAAPEGLWQAIESRIESPTATAWLWPRLAAAGLGAILVGGAWLLRGPQVRPPLPEPIATYLGTTGSRGSGNRGAAGGPVAMPVGLSVNHREMLNRPEQLVLEWARTGGRNK